MHDLMGFQRDTLYIIAGLENPYGWAVKDELEEAYGEEIYDGRLYPNLDSLADTGFVAKSAIDGRTNQYRLTHRGRREIEVHSEWKDQHLSRTGASQ